MMLIGTSFSSCLQSIMLGEVSKEDVLVIITKTRMKNLADVVAVVKEYYYYSSSKHGQEYILEDIIALACELYEAGKIHQPQTFDNFNFYRNSGFVHPELTKDMLWLEVAPLGNIHHPSVLDAYSKYRMISALVK